MSALDQILAAVGGGLEGGLKGYSWAKEMDLEEQQQRERERARRDQSNVRGVDLMLDERALMNDEEESRRKVADKETAQRIQDEWFKTLTPEMQRFFTAKKIGGITTDAEDWKTDAQRGLEKKEAVGQKYLDDELRHTRSMEAESLRHSNRLSEAQARRRLPVEPATPRDNPALPTEVVGYLAQIAGAHDDSTEADYELTSALPELLRAHPRLDPSLARKRLADIYGLPVRPPKQSDSQKPKSDPIESLWAASPVDDPEFADRPGVTEPQRRGDIALPTERRAPRIPFRKQGSPASTPPPTGVAALKDKEDASRVTPTRGAVNPGARALPVDVKEGVGTGRPTAKQIEVKEVPHTGTALPAVTRSPEAGADQRARLEQQATGLITQYRNEKDPAKKAALRSQLARIKAEIQKAQAKPGGQ